jgi:hypothetical protein
MYHPHVHMLVTGGGVNEDGQWVSCKKKYLVPVKALSKMIRGKFAARLRRRHKDLYRHVDPRTWSKDWVANSLYYGQGESVVLNYLARYVFRIAITNHRIISMDQSHVTFRYKDRKGGRWLTCRIEGAEFIRRYLQHVLPKGFHKVRYYGIWHKSNANHVSILAGSIILAAILSGRPITKRENEEPPVTGSKLKCPHCGSDQLILLEQLPRPLTRSPSFEISTCA